MNKAFLQGKWQPFPVSRPNSEEVLIRVQAIGVNRADLLQLKGLYPPPPGFPDIPGLECAGTIVKTGKNVPENMLGQRVMTLLPAGAYADYVTNRFELCLPVPEHLSDEEAATIPEALFTAYLNLVFLANVRKNEKVLVYGAAGGIGTTVLQLVNFYQAQAIAIVGSENKRNFLNENFQVSEIFLHSHPDFPVKILAEHKNSIDIIWDIIGNDASGKLNLALARKYARWLLIGLLGKNKKWELPTPEILTKNLTLIGSTLRNRPTELKIKLAKKIQTELLPAYAEGKLKPVLYRTFPKTEIDKAFRLLTKNQVLGKIVLV